MAATKNCASCANLQENSPEFVQSGVTDKVCTALKNNKGLDASNGHNDCTDLNHANDCLIGNMEDEVDAYGVCDWKEFTKNFIHNLWNVLKAMICAICGLWTNIENLWDKVNKHDCEIAYLFNGETFKIGEEATDGSYIAAGKGVSFLQPSGGDPNASDIRLYYIAGGLLRGIGTVAFHTTNWNDPAKCWNFDEGRYADETSARRGNSNWDSTTWETSKNIVNGGELIYEIRINLANADYKTIKSFHGGMGQEFNMGSFHFVVSVFTSGQWAYGQHGRCKSVEDPTPYAEGMSEGHQVRDGWVYLQLRMTSVDKLPLNNSNNGNYTTPYFLMGIRFKRAQIEC